jgi:hypothetical protein
MVGGLGLVELGSHFPGVGGSLWRTANPSTRVLANRFPLEMSVDWIAPIIVLVVIGGMLFALVGAMLAPVE